MTQIDLLPECIVPPHGQCFKLLVAFQHGERLTVGLAMAHHGVYALSQRCGELRREYGWPIKSRFVETTGGAKVKEYWLEIPKPRVGQNHGSQPCEAPSRSTIGAGAGT